MIDDFRLNTVLMVFGRWRYYCRSKPLYVYRQTAKKFNSQQLRQSKTQKNKKIIRKQLFFDDGKFQVWRSCLRQSTRISTVAGQSRRNDRSSGQNSVSRLFLRHLRSVSVNCLYLYFNCMQIKTELDTRAFQRLWSRSVSVLQYNDDRMSKDAFKAV